MGKRQSAAIEGDQSRSVGDRAPSAATAAGRSRRAGEQDDADRLRSSPVLSVIGRFCCKIADEDGEDRQSRFWKR